MFITPPEILSHFDITKNSFFFFGLQGWFFKAGIKLSAFSFNLAFFTIKFIFISSLLLNNFIFGFLKLYSKYFQLRGRSFRFLLANNLIILKFGYSHKLYFSLLNNICISLINKQVLKISGTSLSSLKSTFFDLHSISKFDRYKGQGLLYYQDQIFLKISSKKTKV
jgi:ribosomal protein L6P/L9E